MTGKVCTHELANAHTRALADAHPPTHTLAHTYTRERAHTNTSSSVSRTLFTCLHQGLWSDITATCRTNFFCEIPDDVVDAEGIDRGALVRAVCKKTGVQLLARA